MSGSKSQQSVQASIKSAVSQNMISAAAAQSLLEPLDDIAAAGAQGVDVDDIDSEEATLVAVVIDASSSMSSHQQAVIDAYNEHFLKPLQGAKNADSIYLTSWIFSASGMRDEYCRLLHGYVGVKNADNLTRATYDPHGGTPLNLAVHRAMTGLVAYGQTLRDAGTNTKCIVVVLSDGEENSSGPKFSSAMVRRLSEDLLKQEIYVLSYCFFGDDSEGAAYAKKIGFPNHQRISADKNNSEIRRILGTVSSSIISASQTAVSAAGLSSNAFFVTP